MVRVSFVGIHCYTAGAYGVCVTPFDGVVIPGSTLSTRQAMLLLARVSFVETYGQFTREQSRCIEPHDVCHTSAKQPTYIKKTR